MSNETNQGAGDGAQSDEAAAAAAAAEAQAQGKKQGGPKDAAARAPRQGQARPPARESDENPSAIASAEAREEQDLERTKRLLAEQPKRRIRIIHPNPKDKKEPNYETCCINGHVIQAQKGVEVEVPETVYQLFVEGGII